MELLSEIEEKASNLREFSGQILKMWESGKPVKDIELEKIRGLLIDPEAMELIIEDISKTIEEYDYTGIYCIVGEAGSGKSQIALFALKELKKTRPDVEPHYIRIESRDDIDKIGNLLENLRGRNVIFIDEMDSLLGSLSEEERKKVVEKLGSILILHAEEPKDNKRIAVILLLNRRSYNAIEKYDQRLWRRIKKFRLGIPTDYERLPPEKLLPLMKGILALIYSAEKDIFPKDHASDVLAMLLEWGRFFRERVTGFDSVGTCVKSLLSEYMVILRNLRKDFMPLDKTEEGDKIEEVLKGLISRYIGKMRFEVEKKQYIAEIMKMEGPGPDLCYDIYPGVIASGRPVKKVNIEIKCGYYSSLKARKDQLIKYGQSGPLLIIWISKEEPEHIEDLINEIEKEIQNPIDYISIPYELMRPAIYLSDPFGFLVDLRIKEDLEAKIQNSLRYIEISSGVPEKAMPKVEDLPKKCKEIAEKLVQKLKPDEKDGKQIKVGITKSRLSEIAGAMGIQIDEKESESIAMEMLSELERQGFFGRETSGSKTFRSRLLAWKTRRNEGVELAASVLVNRIKAIILSL
jgi:ABC-type dipeptide/oligopeptide/nickel transport system ATPase component